MSADESPPNRGESGHQLPTEAAIRELFEVERARIESQDRRWQVREKELLLFDAQNQREFDYFSATRDANLQQQDNRQAFLQHVVWAFSAFFGAVVLAILGFAFLGDDAQRALAQDWGGYGLVAIAGAGVYIAVGRIIRAFTRP